MTSGKWLGLGAPWSLVFVGCPFPSTNVGLPVAPGDGAVTLASGVEYSDTQTPSEAQEDGALDNASVPAVGLRLGLLRHVDLGLEGHDRVRS